jgi:short-chain fatty acids transporter
MAAWSFKYLPDPSIFAVLLTFIAFVLGLMFTNTTPLQMLNNWYKGFWELLTFSMQMALMVITASEVANAPSI